MKFIKLSLVLLLAAALPPLASAALVGPYTRDTNTLFLLHFSEAAGGSVTTNLGLKGGNFYSVNFGSGGTAPPAVTTMLGGTSYSTNAINFGTCETNTTGGYLFGYDFNGDGTFTGDAGGGTLGPDALAMTNLNIGMGGQSPFTLEANIRPTGESGAQEIVCTDSSAGNRAFQFRMNNNTLVFQFITGAQALSPTIPTLAQDPVNGFVPNTWYHVAFTYDGTNGTLYWTKLDPSIGAANVLASGKLTLGTTDGAVTGTLCIGNRGRPNGTETFLGNIDEVRISSVCRAANQMQFFSPLVTITQNPVSQNVDYNQPVSFTVGATTTGSTLGYQWLFNSNGIAGATNAAYTIPNVAAANAGYYSCLVTNTAGYAATSSVVRLVVGAANFLNHRYSFSTSFTNLTTGMVCTPDSISGATGTNFGDAYETNGSLVLDGTAGTYVQLPPGIVNGANQTAVTIESWATYGVNANNVYLFNFGYTNISQAHAYLGYSPHNASGNQSFIASGDANIFNQTATGSATLDGMTVHVVCVYDPPNQTMSIYTNGALEAINTNMTVGLANINDVFSYIGASLSPSDPYLVANVDELRIFNGALSPITIAQSEVQGPNIVLSGGPANFVIQPANTAVPLGQTATFTAAAVGYLPITYQWFKNGTLVPGATNASYSFIPTLSDNNATLFTYATNTIGVTTYVTNSTSATLTVFVPPTLAWLGTGDGGQDNTWNTTSLDWVNAVSGGGTIAFAQTNGVLFDDRSGGGSVDLEQTIIPYNLAVNTAAGYMLLSSGQMGALAGQGSLSKSGAGMLNIDVTNNMSGPVTISGGELQVGYGDTFGSLGSGPVTNNAVLSFYRSDTALVVANAIHGTGTVSFDGSGAVSLNGNDDYSGSTLLNAGIVYLNSATGLGAASAGTTVANGAQLYITGNVNVAEPLTLNGSGDGNGALRKGGAGATTETGAIFLSGDSAIGVDSGATLTLSNSLSGTAALSVIGSGTLTLAAPSSYLNGTTLTGPVVNLAANGALGTGPVTVSGAGRFVLSDGLNFTNFLDATTVNPASGTGLLMVNDNTNGTVTTISGPLEFDASPASGGDFVGPTTSGYLNVTGPVTNLVSGVVSVRSGLVRFSGGGNYTTFDLTGTTSLGANNGLSTNANLMMGVSAAGTFDLNGFSQALAGLSDGAANTELLTNSATALGTLTLNVPGSDTYSGVIAGNIALVVNGSGSLYLAGTNAYTGNTTITSGYLELATPSLAPNSTVKVANGALLELDFLVTNQVAGLVLNGVSQPLGVYSSTTSPAFISGSGSLLVANYINLNPTNIVAKVSGSNLLLSWPADHTGWRLLVQTNHLAQGLSTNTNDWGTVSGSASTDQVTIPLNPAQPVEFYRMTYP